MMAYSFPLIPFSAAVSTLCSSIPYIPHQLVPCATTAEKATTDRSNIRSSH